MTATQISGNESKFAKKNHKVRHTSDVELINDGSIKNGGNGHPL